MNNLNNLTVADLDFKKLTREDFKKIVNDYIGEFDVPYNYVFFMDTLLYNFINRRMDYRKGYYDEFCIFVGGENNTREDSYNHIYDIVTGVLPEYLESYDFSDGGLYYMVDYIYNYICADLDPEYFKLYDVFYDEINHCITRIFDNDIYLQKDYTCINTDIMTSILYLLYLCLGDFLSFIMERIIDLIS